MPTEIVGQNGAVIKQNTKIALQGCKKGQGIPATLSRTAAQASARSVPQAS